MPRSRTYTSTTDFEEGVLDRVTTEVTGELRTNVDFTTFNYIWVAVSSKGTVARLDVLTGEVLGEYWTSPAGQPRNPSRTSVDENGCVWIANRDGNSVTHIVTPESNLWVDRNHNGRLRHLDRPG